MLYSSEKYLAVFEQETREERIENIFRKGVKKYRCKTFRAGMRLECEIYPLWDNKAQVRKAKSHRSRAAQAKLNSWNRQKKVDRYTNENFQAGDYWGTLTYDDEHLPKDEKQARRDIVNYLRRVKRRYEKLGLELKYIYVIGGERYHHHIIISGGLDRTELEKMWNGGGRTQMRILQPDKRGLTGVAMYISKGKNMRTRWGHSQNLKYPKPTIADNKISKRRAEELAGCEDEARGFFERAYPGHQFEAIKPKYSNYVSGVYLYVEMWKKEEGTLNIEETKRQLDEIGRIIRIEGEEYVTLVDFQQLYWCTESQVRHWQAKGLPCIKHKMGSRMVNLYPIERSRAWFAGEEV